MAFCDLEDGNYLTTDKKLNLHCLLHNAKPTVKKLKYSLTDIIFDIENKMFDQVSHLEQRYNNNA